MVRIMPVAALWLTALSWTGPPRVQADAEGPASGCSEAGDAPEAEASHPEPAPEGASCAQAAREGVRAVAFVWTAPHFALEQPLSRAFRHAPYPYADGEPGLLRFGEPVPRLRNPRAAHVSRCAPPEGAGTGYRCLPRRSAPFRASLGLAAGVLTEGAASAQAAFRLYTPQRLSPTLQWQGRSDWRTPGGSWAHLGHAGLDYRFAQRERLSLRSGLGALLTHDEVRGTRAGGYLAYGLHWWPRRPWALEAGAAVGGVAGAFYGRLQLTASVSWRRLQLGLGYDHVTLRGAAVTRWSGPRLYLSAWL